MASPNFDFPHYPPPPPHVRPPPHPLPPSPDHNHTTVIVIVFVSFGGLFFLCFLAFGIFCLIKKRKMKKKIVEKTELVHVDEHLKMKEAIVEGPHGPKAVVLEIEDDFHVDERLAKKQEEKFKSGTTSTMASSSTSDDHKHLQLEHKA